MSAEQPVKRQYRQDARERQARERRLAVIAAATRLFVERGYGATTVDAIAAEAGVARATVFAVVGGKPALMRAAYDVAVAGGDERGSRTRDVWHAQLTAARTGEEVVASYVDVLADVHARLAPVYESLRSAATTDAELAELLTEVDAARLVGARRIIEGIEQRGAALRPGLSVEEAADILWTLGDPSLYRRLRASRGWDAARYHAWLTDLLQRELLAAP